MKKVTRKQYGFTLTELLVVLVAVAIILGGIALRGMKTDNKRQANDMATSYSSLVSMVHSVRSQTGTYNGLTSAEINGMNVVVDPLKWDGTNITDPWSNPITFAGNAANTAMTWAVTIGGTVNPLDREVCNILATILAKSADVVNIGTSTAVTITNGLVSGGSVYKASSSATPSAANLSTGCQAANPVIGLQYH